VELEELVTNKYYSGRCRAREEKRDQKIPAKRSSERCVHKLKFHWDQFPVTSP